MLKELQGNKGRERSGATNTYKGIPMFCDLFLHERSFTYVEKEAKNTRILVLGSGSGAFDQRLVDHGFTNVTSVDFRPDFFRAQGTTFLERDLNYNFSDIGTYDLIIAIELIEHLENPAHFLRNVSMCLAPSGKLIVTTPNIESGPSRASFFIQSTLSFFTQADLIGSGHITLLPQHIFLFHVHNAGLVVHKQDYNRNAWGARFSSNRNEIFSTLKTFSLLRALNVVLKTLLLILISPLTLLKRSNGNIHIYVLRKS